MVEQSSVMKPDLKEVHSQPQWQLFHVDLVQQTFKLAYLEEQHYRDASFLDARALKTRQPVVDCRLDRLASSFHESQRLVDLRLIFHIGHCGSTLLSRALSEHETILPLREPMPAITLANAYRELGSPMSWLSRDQAEALQLAIVNSFRRPFAKTQCTLVKLTSSCNNMISPLLTTYNTARALLIYLTLERYLAAMFLQGAQSVDVRRQMQLRMQDWATIPEAPALKLSDLSILQMAAVSWVTNMYYFLSLSEQLLPRARLLDFEKFQQDPALGLVTLCNHFHLQDRCDDLMASYHALSGSYAKNPGQKYDLRRKQMQLQEVRKRHSAEIASVISWLQTMVDDTPALQPVSDYFE